LGPDINASIVKEEQQEQQSSSPLNLNQSTLSDFLN